MLDLAIYAALALLALVALLVAGSLVLGILVLPLYLLVNVWDALRSLSAEDVAERERLLADA